MDSTAGIRTVSLALLAIGASALSRSRATATARDTSSFPVTCALNSSATCPLPPWPATYNLSQSSIVYQPWCIDNGDPYLCTNLINISAWWGRSENRADNSWREAHWGLISLDDSTSTNVWQQPGDVVSASAQEVMLANCNHVKENKWADRCFVYDNMVNGLGWYRTHREKMLNASTYYFFNLMSNENATQGLQNWTGLPYQETGGVVPIWDSPPTSPDPTLQWTWPLEDARLPCYARGDCNKTAGGGGVCMYWNYSRPGVIDWRVGDNLAFVRAGGDGVDGLFTDEMEMFPGDHGGVVLETIGTTEDDARAQQAAGNVAHQRFIDGLVAEGKYLWHAFQAGNDIGHNNNNNSVGGVAHDAAFCTSWMSQRCNTAWVNSRAITVQFDEDNVNVSIASFLVVRPAYAWIGWGAGYFTPRWNDAFLWDVGLPVGNCSQVSPGVFEREWTYGTAHVDCNTYTATVPCNPADSQCGEPPRPPPPPPIPGKWSAQHNCTSCQAPPAQPLEQHTNIDRQTCFAYCSANPKCAYVNWVEPDDSGECSLWAECGEMCLTDHCWNWWVTFENLDRARPAWNATACDSLPEKPSSA